ncbi:hypothetical protein ACWCQ0_39220 [Streptomyces massasporeus]|uniref:hypothetical protein n=1 Tax=Streptomyces massasporeus TaxID=67324 RepID=UPI003402D406
MPFDTTCHHDTGDYHDGPPAIPRRHPPGMADANGAADPMAGAAGGTVASAAGHRPTRLTGYGGTAVPLHFHRTRQRGVTTALRTVGRPTRFVGHEAGTVFASSGGAAPGQYAGRHLLEG